MDEGEFVKLRNGLRPVVNLSVVELCGALNKESKLPFIAILLFLTIDTGMLKKLRKNDWRKFKAML